MQFDITDYYSLTEAFERTGHTMFPAEWTGIEGWAARADDPAQTQAERRTCLDDIDQIEAKIEPLNRKFRRDLSDEELNAANAAIHILKRDLKQAEERLKSIPNVSEWRIQDFEAYTRRKAVEVALREAFAAKTLWIRHHAAAMLDWRAVNSDPAFRICFRLSILRLPYSEAGNQRRAPAFIRKDEFHDWLKIKGLANIAKSDLTPTEQVHLWMREQIKRDVTRQFTRDEYFELAKAECPAISERGFRRIWASETPDHWRKGGRPKTAG